MAATTKHSPAATQSVADLMASLGQEARTAARALAQATTQAKNAALLAAAGELRAQTPAILAANERDMAAATTAGRQGSFLDRLALDPKRIEGIAKGLEDIAALPDPVGSVMAQWTRPNGLEITRVRTPLGVIGIIYESRPNVTADAGALCLKAGNAAILRGGSDSYHSSRAIQVCLARGLRDAGLPETAIQLVPIVDREAVGLMLEGLGGSISQFLGNEALREGVLGLIAMIMVGTLVVHMWRTGPKLRERMHQRLGQVSTGSSRFAALAGVFLFTFLMITREGMETALMLMQVRDPQVVSGALLGLGAAMIFALGWARFGHLINVKRFFQVTGIFLLLFMVQVGIYSFHEFSEAGLLPNSEMIHDATEKFSPDGLYGKWFSLVMIAVCALWLLAGWANDRLHRHPPAGPLPEPAP